MALRLFIGYMGDTATLVERAIAVFFEKGFRDLAISYTDGCEGRKQRAWAKPCWRGTECVRADGAGSIKSWPLKGSGMRILVR